MDWLTKPRFLKGAGFYVLRDQDDNAAEFTSHISILGCFIQSVYIDASQFWYNYFVRIATTYIHNNVIMICI